MDFCNSISSNELPLPRKKMNRLDELSKVCSMLFNGLSPEEKSPLKANITDVKKLKSLNAQDFTCVDDVRNLNPKSLVEKFSESASDELKRRYSYKCKFLPDECDKIFESYGNEKKANDNMKQHLLIHLYDLEERISSGAWPPVCKKTDQDDSLIQELKKKLSKKSLKSEHPFGVKMPPKRKVNMRNKKKHFKSSVINSPRKDKKAKEVHSHSSSKLYNLCVSPFSHILSPNQFCQKFTVNLNESDIKNEENIFEEIVQDNTFEICGPLCPHVNCSLSKPSTSQGISTTFKYSFDNLFFPLSKLLVQTITHEHSYSLLNGMKKEKILPEAVKYIPPAKKRGCCIPPQLIIKTPPFPHVHVPLLPDCAGIEEVGLDYSVEDMMRDTIDYSSDTKETHYDGYGDVKSPFTKMKRLNKKLKQQEVSSSVLECVENRVDMNASAIRVPNNLSLSPEHNNENSENVQKAEKERALRYISKLKSKKKKQCQGPLECRICEHKKFTALATLIHHYRSHAGIKPYSCKLCEGTFTRKHSLNYHMLIHRNISRFNCPYCLRAFRHPSHYKEHLRRHTGETPFVCPSCLLKFKTRNTFKRHLKIQHRKLLTAHGIMDLPPLEIDD